jgi:hypothetical protein
VHAVKQHNTIHGYVIQTVQELISLQAVQHMAVMLRVDDGAAKHV